MNLVATIWIDYNFHIQKRNYMRKYGTYFIDFPNVFLDGLKNSPHTCAKTVYSDGGCSEEGTLWKTAYGNEKFFWYEVWRIEANYEWFWSERLSHLQFKVRSCLDRIISTHQIYLHFLRLEFIWIKFTGTYHGQRF